MIRGVKYFIRCLCIILVAQLAQAQAGSIHRTYSVAPFTKAIFDIHELYDFKGLADRDGSTPSGSLFTARDGSIYGTTTGNSYLPGTVYRLTPSVNGYTERLLYSFASDGAGGGPRAGVIVDKFGAIYGTTSAGGSANSGTVFKLTPVGGRYHETVIHNFLGGVDGSNPASGVVQDASGAIYGTTEYGGDVAGSSGSGYGTVYEIEKVGNQYFERILYKFKGGTDGANPVGTPVLDSTGDVFGTTENGGEGNAAYADGTVYELVRSPSSNVYFEHVLWRFQGGSDGTLPESGLLPDNNGNLIGTTLHGGGGGGSECLFEGCGTVFSIQPTRIGAGSEQVLYRFQGGADGANPVSSVSSDSFGRLYGTTYSGGEIGSSCTEHSFGCGTIFELAPTQNGYVESIAYRFTGNFYGSFPIAGVVATPDGNVIFGATAAGGDINDPACDEFPPPYAGCGTTFKLTRNAR